MKRILFLLISFIVCSIKSFSTWSIIMIDPKTHEIGIVGASCTYNCYGIGKIIPNKGAIIVQAMSNNQARNRGVEMILANATPEQIIQALRHPEYDPERQQYAVVTIKYINHPATYTGDLTNPFRGSLTKTGISIQGNTLTSDSELRAIMQAIENAQKASLNFAETLMRALEAGAIAGGDKRCGEQKSTSAFIIIAKPNDKKPYMDLNIFGQGKGGQNAVEMLRKKFDKWITRHKS